MDQKTLQCYRNIFTALDKLPNKMARTRIKWAHEPSVDPQQSVHEKAALDEIIKDDIRLALEHDELQRYATEQHGQYFDQAWGKNGVDKFKAAHAYFKNTDDFPIVLDFRTSKILSMDLPKTHVAKLQRKERKANKELEKTLQQILPDKEKPDDVMVKEWEGYIGDLKGQFEAMATHIEHYKQSLEYQRKVVGKTLSFITTHMKKDHGKHSPRVAFDAKAGEAAQYEEAIKDFLVQEHVLEDPLIGHHMYQACDAAYQPTRKGSSIDDVGEVAKSFRLNVSNAVLYFKALGKNLKTNIEGCQAIIDVCHTNQKQVDTIVAKEKASAGLNAGGQ